MFSFESRRNADVVFGEDGFTGLWLFCELLEPYWKERGPFYGFMSLLHDYVMHLLSSELGRDVYVKYINWVLNVYSRRGYGLTPVGSLMFNWDYREVYGFVDRRFLSPEELKQVVEVLGSAALGVALALIDKLSSIEGCRSAVYCSDLLDTVVRAVNERVVPLVSEGVLLVPNQYVYDKVMEFFDDFLLPFVSEVPVEGDVYDELYSLFYEGFSKLLEWEKLLKFRVLLRRDGVMAVVRVTPQGELYVVLEMGPLVYEVNARLGSDFRSAEPYVLIKGKFDEARDLVLPERDIILPELCLEAKELARNWLDYVVRVLSRLAAQLKTYKDLPPEVVKTVSDYIRAWLKVFTRYRDRIEEYRRPQ
ncbi:MAG: hypothetical protein QXD83_04155 [Sulfolobales archaeon]